MSFKKLKKSIVTLGIVGMLGIGSLTVQASNHSFSWSFGSTSGNISTDYYAKSDNDANWYLSLDKKNGSTSNTLSSKNIFGCKMHRSYSDSVDSYHLFSNYVSSYKISYKSTVGTGDNMKLTGKKDDSSTSSAALKISGRFCP